MDNLAADFIINLNSPIEAEFEVGETEHFDCSFELFASGTVWGSIDGNIENQTDLYDILSTQSGQITSNHNEITSLNQTLQSYGDIVTYDAADFATAAQGTLANTALQPGDNITELNNNAGYITSASLPTVNDGTLTIQVNSTDVGTFSANQSTNKTINIPVPDSATWGNITGDIDDQTDLKNALSAKYDASNPDGFISGINGTDVVNALGYTPYNSTNPDGYITSSALSNYVTINSAQTITANKSFHNAELITDNFITLNGTTAYLRGQSGINYYNLMNLNSSGITVGSANQPIKIAGNATRPKYNSSDLALYSDIPTVNDGTLTIQVNGTSVGTFTANQSGNTTANIVVPDSATWGNITGDIADQTDLQDALDDKQDVLSGGRYIEIVSGGTIATLPEGCKQVEYITATGTQHLDTLITATNDYEIRAKFRLTELNDSFLYGARQAYGSSSFALHKNYAPFSTDVGTGYVNLGVDSWYNVKQNKNGIYINDLLAHAYNNSLASFTTPNTIRVFAMAQGNNALYGSTFMKGDFASFEIYNNGVLVCNLVPCIDSNDVACMYDTINERFLYNLGTGNFTAGAEVVPSDTINCTLDGSDINTLLGYTPVNPSSLATVATSGDYDDLTNKPTIPTVGDGTITITQGGVQKGTFTTNQSGNSTIALDAGGSGGIQNTATGYDSLTILGVPTGSDFCINIGVASESGNDGVAIGYEAITYNGVAIGRETTNTSGNVAIGNYASVDNSADIAIGESVAASGSGAIALGYQSGANGTNAICIGSSSSANANNAIQIGNGDNSDANTLQIGNYTLLDTSTGLIPDARLSSNICTTNTAQSISGRKTFLGEKAIYFKQSATTNKLGFTLYNPSDTELGAFEWRPNTIGGGALLNVNVPYSSSNYVGFRYWGTAVNIIAPKVATAGNYYIPVNITDGNTTVTANSNGTLNISSLLPTVPTNISSFTNDSGYITGITSSDVTTALGYTPYNSTNPNGYITGITSSDVTTALGYTPYNSTNPNGYISGITSSDVTAALGYTPLNTDASNLSSTGQKVFDGVWVDQSVDLASNVSMAASASKNYSLSSYLPNDGAIYEVKFSIEGETGNTSGNGLEYRAYSDVLTSSTRGGVIAGRTRTSSTMLFASSFILPIGSGRKIYIDNSNSSSSSTLVYLRAQGYRRVGTNT